MPTGDEHWHERLKQGKYYHYPINNPEATNQDRTSSKSPKIIWGVARREIWGSRAYRKGKMPQPLIAPYDYEWQAKSHAEMMNNDLIKNPHNHDW